MKRFHLALLIYLVIELVGMPLQAKDKPFQLIHGLLYRMERVDSLMRLNMSLDLRRVHLTPDCTVYLIPQLYSGTDTLELPPVMLNGPQSDMMYRRHKALGNFIEPTIYEPHTVLREGDHELPVINYRKGDIPWQPWMETAELRVLYKSYNADARLVPIKVEFEQMPPMLVERIDTIIIHDTICIEKPAYIQPITAKDIITEYADCHTDVYFPVSGMKILPDHRLNRDAWHSFVSEIDALLSDSSNLILSITITGYSSPEGNYQNNDILAKRRALALKNFFETQYSSMQVELRTEWVAEDWGRLAEMVRTSNMPDKEKVLDIIDNVDIFKGREAKLMALSGGRPWAYMLKEFFPKLRCASCRVGYLKRSEK